MKSRIDQGNLRVRRARAGLVVMGLLASAFVAIQPAQAATVRYVDQNNSHCTNTGVGSQGFPFCSIGAAAKIAVAGDTVQVLNGTYVENVPADQLRHAERSDHLPGSFGGYARRVRPDSRFHGLREELDRDHRLHGHAHD